MPRLGILGDIDYKELADGGLFFKQWHSSIPWFWWRIYDDGYMVLSIYQNAKFVLHRVYATVCK